MNLRGVDLNLLVILDALLDEAHVSRAADRVGLTQPAASAALDRCRRLFRDRLLERGRGTMRLTPKAESLRAPLKDLLAQTVALVDPPALRLDEIRRTVRLSMADQPAALVLAPLLRALRETAPGIDLALTPWRGGAAERAALIEGSSDLAVTLPSSEGEGLRQRRLLSEIYVAAMRADHPAAREFGLEIWLAHPHVLVSGRGDRRGPLDAVLAERGLSRRIGLTVPSFLLAIPALTGSDLIALLPSRVAAATPGLATFPPPIPVPGFELHLVWRARDDADPAIRHVAGLIAGILT
jgi:DNA-binding transcriptional LysR family regulator